MFAVEVPGVKVVYVARLGDLGLGNPDGIPSALALADEARLRQHAYGIINSIVAVTNKKACGCIDGRECLHNGDGSAADERRGQVGASGLSFEVGYNSDAAVVVESMALKDPFWVTVDRADKAAFDAPASHTGGCGGVNGAVVDNEAIAETPAIMKAVATIASLPEVQAFTGFTYVKEAGDLVKERSLGAAKILSESWTGPAYVEHIEATNPAGVQVLAVDESAAFKGHAEPSVVAVLSLGRDKTVSKNKMNEGGQGRPFVWNIDASWDMAERINPERPGVAFVANVAKHVAVCNRLPSDKTPFFFVVIDE